MSVVRGLYITRENFIAIIVDDNYISHSLTPINGEYKKKKYENSKIKGYFPQLSQINVIKGDIVELIRQNKDVYFGYLVYNNEKTYICISKEDLKNLDYIETPEYKHFVHYIDLYNNVIDYKETPLREQIHRTTRSKGGKKTNKRCKTNKKCKTNKRYKTNKRCKTNKRYKTNK